MELSAWLVLFVKLSACWFFSFCPRETYFVQGTCCVLIFLFVELIACRFLLVKLVAFWFSSSRKLYIVFSSWNWFGSWNFLRFDFSFPELIASWFFFSPETSYIFIFFNRETYTLIFILLQLILFMELSAYRFLVPGTHSLLFFFVKLLAYWFFLVVKLIHWFFSTWNWFYWWNLLLSNFCSWNLLHVDFSLHETCTWFLFSWNWFCSWNLSRVFVHGTCCVLILVRETCWKLIFLFVKLVHWFSHVLKQILFMELLTWWFFVSWTYCLLFFCLWNFLHIDFSHRETCTLITLHVKLIL